MNKRGQFGFLCDNSPVLCSCIQHVGYYGEEQKFIGGYADNWLELNVFRNKDYFVSYGILEYEILNGVTYVYEITYGDVNKKNILNKYNNRRRRLLNGPHGGTS